MRQLRVLAAQLSHQLHVVVAGHAVRRLGRNHSHDELENIGNPWSSIDEVAKEHGLSSSRMAPDAFRAGSVVERLQQFLELIRAAVDIPNDVERPMIAL